jgi:hypothetical protein
MSKGKGKRDWAHSRAERFYLTHTKLCQGPNAGPENTAKWIDALADCFRATRKSAEKRGYERGRKDGARELFEHGTINRKLQKAVRRESGRG